MSERALLVMAVTAATLWLGGLGLALYNALSIVAE